MAEKRGQQKTDELVATDGSVIESMIATPPTSLPEPRSVETTTVPVVPLTSPTVVTGSSGKNGKLQEINYVNNDHINSAFSAMNYMRKVGQMCDITLEVNGSELKAHRVVLSATNAYFSAMFKCDLSEKNASVISLRDIDFNALSVLIDYLYTGEIVISEDNVQALLPVASLLQVNTVRDACCKFLLRQLDPSNCLGIRQFADAHACEELHQTSDKYVVENFPLVSITEEFLLLPMHQVEALISSNQLNVLNEEIVYDAVMRWLKHDLKNRQQYLGQLLQHIRLPLTTSQFLLNRVSQEPLIVDNADGKDLLIEAMKYYLSPEKRDNMSTTRTQPRKPDGMRTYIFAIGGGSLFSIHNECEFYMPYHDQWYPFAATSTRRSRVGVTALGRFIYAIGGYNENKELSSGEYYDPLSNYWWPIKSMVSKRSCLGIAALNGLIYVGGGYDGASCLDSVERFDPLVEIWSSGEPMNIRRRHGRMAALDGALYAVGGYDGSNYQASVERLDPREGKWHVVASMSNRRSNCGLASICNKLYAVGGNDGSLSMNSVECYDPVKNEWELMAPMHSRRGTHELVQANGYLYAIGGNDGSSSLNTVEQYDPQLNKWCLVRSMRLRRSCVGAAALDCPALEYLNPPPPVKSTSDPIPLNQGDLNVQRFIGSKHQTEKTFFMSFAVTPPEKWIKFLHN